MRTEDFIDEGGGQDDAGGNDPIVLNEQLVKQHAFQEEIILQSLATLQLAAQWSP